MRYKLASVIGLFLLIHQARGQSIQGIWLSKDSLTCIEFDSTLHRMNISDWFEKDWKTSKQKFIYTIKNGTLKIVWYYYGKTVCYYKIDHFIGNKLSLSILKDRVSVIPELMGGYQVEFQKTDTCSSCNDYYLKRGK
jgi:hypothetical protein